MSTETAPAANRQSRRAMAAQAKGGARAALPHAVQHGPDAARAYLDLGLRVVPIKADTKRPTITGFGDPAWTAQPKDFKHADQVGILCGATHPHGHLRDRALLCIDLDGALETRGLCKALGVTLPDTLATHRGKHLWYWVAPGELADQLKQWAGILGVRRSWTGEGKAPDADLKWHGGYAVERGAPSAFDTTQIALLPDECLRALIDAPGVPKHEPSAEPTELPEPRLLEQAEADAILEAVVEEWPDAGQGRHDCALAFGGALRRTGASREDAEALASALVEATGSDAGRVNDVLDAWDRTDEGRPAYGRSTLATLLLNEGRKTLAAITLAQDPWLAMMIDKWPELIACLDAQARATAEAQAARARALVEQAVDALPPWVREHVAAVQHSLRLPLGVHTAYALGALSCAAQGRLKVRVKRGWVEHTNLLVCVVADSGEGKSPAFNAAIGPIETWERAKRERERGDFVQQKQEREIDEGRRKSLQALLYKQLGPDAETANTEERSELMRLAVKLDTKPAPVEFRYIISDATQAAAANLLAIHGRLAVLNDDADGVFQVLAGKYNNNVADIDLWLHAYNGRFVPVDRIGRRSEEPRYEDTTLAAVLSLQPERFRVHAKNAHFVGQGLTQRITWVKAPPTGVRYEDDEDEPEIPQAVEDAYGAALTRMLERGPRELRLSPDAHAARKLWRQELDTRSRGEKADVADIRGWVSKHQGRTIRIAALLHDASDANGSEISGETMRRAIAIGRWLLENARDALRGNTGGVLHDDLEDRLLELVAAGHRKLGRLQPKITPGQRAQVPAALERLVEQGRLTLDANGYRAVADGR